MENELKELKETVNNLCYLLGKTISRVDVLEFAHEESTTLEDARGALGAEDETNK